MGPNYEIYGNMFASALAGATSSVIFHPLDVLRVRWQQQPAGVNARSTNVLQFTTQILRHEGFVHGLLLPAVGTQVCGNDDAFSLMLRLSHIAISKVMLAFVTMGAKWGCYPMVR